MKRLKIEDFLAEDDACILQRYAELELDSKRMNAARKAAKRMAEEYDKKATTLKKVSNRKTK